MKEVKIFSGADERDLEKQLNEFLRGEGKDATWHLQGYSVVCIDPADGDAMDYSAVIIRK